MVLNQADFVVFHQDMVKGHWSINNIEQFICVWRSVEDTISFFLLVV